MAETTSYCDAVRQGVIHEIHYHYHDYEYGFPIEDDNELFARLMLEANQAGLSWETILKKKDGFMLAYDGFDIGKVARYTELDRQRLMSDARIIRNKLKINAAIYNANAIMAIQKEFGSFKNWLDINHPLSKDSWVKLFKKHFKFTGGEVTNEFLMSTGYLKGAHIESCPIYSKISKLNPKWMS